MSMTLCRCRRTRRPRPGNPQAPHSSAALFPSWPVGRAAITTAAMTDVTAMTIGGTIDGSVTMTGGSATVGAAAAAAGGRPAFACMPPNQHLELIWCT